MEGMMKEYLLRWQLNGEWQTELLCSPGDTETLLRGRLLTERLIRRSSDIAAVTENADGSRSVTAKTVPLLPDVSTRLAGTPRCESALHRTIPELNALCGEMLRIEKRSGRHTCILAAGETRFIARDIGRHNALDRAVGQSMIAGVPAGEAVLCTSGRVSLEMLAKTAAAGIPIVCTRKQVGELAAVWAERLGIAAVQLGSEARVFGDAARVTG